jgi:hypothetical protein
MAKKKRKKKKPPKRAKKPRRSPVKKRPETQTKKVTVEVELTEESEQKGMGYIRWMAGQYYATNLNHCTLRDMNKHPMFGTVSQTTLNNWSSEDKWVQRRQDFQDRIRSKVEHAIANEIVKHRTTQLASAQRMFDDALGKLLPDDKDQPGPEVKSYEGLMRAITQLGDLLDRWRSSLGETLVPMVAFDGPDDGAQISLPVKPQLTEGESRAAAKLLIKMRREDLRRKRAEVEAEESGTTKPTLHVVEGE